MIGWTPSIKYNDSIREKMTVKLRNALIQNNIKVLNMNMEDEEYYEKQLAYFMFKRLLNYYENRNIEFEIVPMEKILCAFKVSEDIITSYLQNMVSFRNKFLKLNDDYSIPIDTKNESEITVLNEKFEKIPAIFSPEKPSHSRKYRQRMKMRTSFFTVRPNKCSN